MSMYSHDLVGRHFCSQRQENVHENNLEMGAKERIMGGGGGGGSEKKREREEQGAIGKKEGVGGARGEGRGDGGEGWTDVFKINLYALTASNEQSHSSPLVLVTTLHVPDPFSWHHSPPLPPLPGGEGTGRGRVGENEEGGLGEGRACLKGSG
jgi:hypothetical protein